LKFAVHRSEYRRRLRLALKEYDLSLLAYCIALLDLKRVLELLEDCSGEDLASNYLTVIAEDIADGRLVREAAWAESIAVGSQAFVEGIAAEIWNREELERLQESGDRWALREARFPYGPTRPGGSCIVARPDSAISAFTLAEETTP